MAPIDGQRGLPTGSVRYECYEMTWATLIVWLGIQERRQSYIPPRS